MPHKAMRCLLVTGIGKAPWIPSHLAGDFIISQPMSIIDWFSSPSLRFARQRLLVRGRQLAEDP